MTAAIGGLDLSTSHRPRRAPRRVALRAMVWLAVLAVFAVFAFAVTFTVGHVEESGAGAANSVVVVHGPPVAVGHTHGTETLQIRGMHAQPVSRTRAVLAVLAVGIVVAALARRKLLLGVRAVAPAFRHTSLRSGRGPPLARIA